MDASFKGLRSRRQLIKAACLAAASFRSKTWVSSSIAGGLPNDASVEVLSLQERAARKGLFFGSAVVSSKLSTDLRLMQAVSRDCGLLVPDSELKWSRIQGGNERGVLDFAAAESIYEFAKKRGLRMRGHTLVWHNGIPPWVLRQLGSGYSASFVGDMLHSHVTEVVAAWKGRLVHWDVVNEPLSAGEQDVWRNKLGEYYIDLAFKAAKAADPSALLVLNQDLVELDHPYQRQLRRKFLDLLERLLKRGVPVEAVGVEGHLYGNIRFNAAEYDAFLRTIEQMGLKLIVTELDVWDGKVSGDVATRDKVAASLVKQFLDVSLSHRNCLGVITWTLTDLYAWYRQVPGKWRVDGQLNRAGLLDDNYQRKLIWNAVADAFDSAFLR